MKKNKRDIYDLLSAISDKLSAEELMFSNIASDLATQIVARRIDLGLTQAELAEKMGRTQATISKWESAECNFQLKTLIEIAQKLSLPLTVAFKSIEPKTQVYCVYPTPEVISASKYTGGELSHKYTCAGSSSEQWDRVQTNG